MIVAIYARESEHFSGGRRMKLLRPRWGGSPGSSHVGGTNPGRRRPWKSAPIGGSSEPVFGGRKEYLWDGAPNREGE